MPVFGLLKRGGQVHAVMIPNIRSTTLMPIIRQRVEPDAVVYSDGYFSYNVLDVSEFRHVRVDMPQHADDIDHDPLAHTKQSFHQ